MINEKKTFRYKILRGENIMKKYVYVAYSKDKYKLPVVVADSLGEVSRKIGIDTNTISAAISHAKRSGCYCRFAKVDIS